MACIRYLWIKFLYKMTCNKCQILFLTYFHYLLGEDNVSLVTSEQNLHKNWYEHPLSFLPSMILTWQPYKLASWNDIRTT